MSNTALQQDQRHTAFISDVAERLEALFLEAGFDEETTQLLSEKFANQIADNWQGQRIYIPTNYRSRVNAIHNAIRVQFTGNNQKELAEKFQMHIRTIYKILS